MDLRPSARFSVEMHKFLRFLAEYLAALAFLCCHNMFDSYITCLTLSLCTSIQINFFLLLSRTVFISAALKSILNQSRCSLEPKNFLRALRPLNPPLGSQETPSSPSYVKARYAHFSANYIIFHQLIFAYRYPIEENQQRVISFFF